MASMSLSPKIFCRPRSLCRWRGDGGSLRKSTRHPRSRGPNMFEGRCRTRVLHPISPWPSIRFFHQAGQSRSACLLYLHAILELRVFAKGAPEFAQVSDPAGRGTPRSIAPFFCSSQKINISSRRITRSMLQTLVRQNGNAEADHVKDPRCVTR
jgi:hypothetical protein